MLRRNLQLVVIVLLVTAAGFVRDGPIVLRRRIDARLALAGEDHLPTRDLDVREPRPRPRRGCPTTMLKLRLRTPHLLFSIFRASSRNLLDIPPTPHHTAPK
jgi:hypothetical protein